MRVYSVFSVLLIYLASDQTRWDQLLIRVRLFATPWIAACQASLSITNSWSSLKLTSIESVMPSSHLIFCGPLFLLPLAKVLEIKLQRHSFQWTPRTDLLQNGLVESPCSPRDSQKSSSQSNSCIHTWPLEKPQPWLDRPLLANWCLCFQYAI